MKNTQINNFMANEKQKMIQRFVYRGFTPVGEQHNGFLMARIDSEDMLHRRVIRSSGQFLVYIPRKATTREKQMYPKEV